jgi:hypothetical protein
VTNKIKMVRHQRGPIEIWLPENCIGDTMTIDRPDGMTDQEYVDMLEMYQRLFDGLCNVVGDDL